VRIHDDDYYLRHHLQSPYLTAKTFRVDRRCRSVMELMLELQRKENYDLDVTNTIDNCDDVGTEEEAERLIDEYDADTAYEYRRLYEQ